MGVTLKAKSGAVNLATDLKNVIIEGGYYTPAVDEAGVLSWIPSRDNMAAVDSVNIKGADGKDGKDGAAGAKGDKGEQGVYVGETEPTDNSLIWLNPNGEAATGIATKAYVDAAIEAAIGSSIYLVVEKEA